MVPRCRAWCWNEQDDYRDRTKHPAIARLGRFSSQLPSATDGDLSPGAATAQLHHVQADHLERHVDAFGSVPAKLNAHRGVTASAVREAATAGCDGGRGDLRLPRSAGLGAGG